MELSSTFQPPITESADVHTSVALERLIADAPADHFTLDWLIAKLPKRSFGFILLFLALISLLPVISFVSRILIIILTFQIIFGYRSPVLPRRIMERKLPSKYLKQLSGSAVPALRHLEKIARPRFPLMLRGTRRFTALTAMISLTLSLVSPLPLSNMPVALITVLMALSYIEHDGLMLLLALTTAFSLLGFVVWFLLQTFSL